jgi:hypothetical protein
MIPDHLKQVKMIWDPTTTLDWMKLDQKTLDHWRQVTKI